MVRLNGCRIVLAFALPLLAGATNASAQVFGTFPWQMQPYCNVVTLTLTNTATGFTLDGTDDQCGASDKGSATGTASFGASGNVALNFTIVAAPSGRPLHVSAIVSPATGNGTWSDSNGNTGSFAFFAATAGLPARPAPAEFKISTLGTLAAPAGSTVVTTWAASPVYNNGGGVYTAAAGTYAVPSAGLYLVTASLGMSANNSETGNRCLVIYLGSSTQTADCRPPSPTIEALTATSVVSAAAGQVIAVRAQNNTTGAFNVVDAGIADWTITKLR